MSSPTLWMIADKHSSIDMNRREQATRPTIWFVTDLLGLWLYAGGYGVGPTITSVAVWVGLWLDAGRQGCRPLRCEWLRSIIPSKDTQDLWARQKKSKIPLGKPKGIFYRWFVIRLRYFAKIGAKEILLVTKIFLCNMQFFPQNSQSDWQKVTFCMFWQSFVYNFECCRRLLYSLCELFFANYLLDKMLTM